MIMEREMKKVERVKVSAISPKCMKFLLGVSPLLSLQVAHPPYNMHNSPSLLLLSSHSCQPLNFFFFPVADLLTFTNFSHKVEPHHKEQCSYKLVIAY